MGFWEELVVEAFPSIVGGVGDYLTSDEERDYNAQMTDEERAYNDRVRAEENAREDEIRAEQYARADKQQALSLQLEAIKARYQQNPYLARMMLSPGEALATKSRDSDRKQDAIKTLIAAIQNPLLSRA